MSDSSNTDGWNDGLSGTRLIGWQPRPWWAWTLGALLLGTVAMLTAGLMLSTADLGTSLRARACDTSALLGIGLLVAGGAWCAAGIHMARLHGEGALLSWDAGTILIVVPIPLTLLGLALPGMLGCALSQQVAAIPLVGAAFVGSSGVAMAGAAATLTGVALASAMQVSWATPAAGSEAHEPPGLVELAMEEAEALRADPAAARFHGVD